MARPKRDTAVLTIRVPAAIDRRLAQEARRLRRTRSQVARDILEAGLSTNPVDPRVEARRQSLLVSRRKSERDVLRFILDASDTSGWK
jgi:predicted transcriptional regulator